MFPTVVVMEAEIDLHEGPPLRSFRPADEAHSGFLRRAVGLLSVAGDAGTDNVLPCGGSAAIARNDMIQVQVFPVEHMPAILARVFVPFKNVVPGEFDFLLWKSVEHDQEDDARDADAE